MSLNILGLKFVAEVSARIPPAGVLGAEVSEPVVVLAVVSQIAKTKAVAGIQPFVGLALGRASDRGRVLVAASFAVGAVRLTADAYLIARRATVVVDRRAGRRYAVELP